MLRNTQDLIHARISAADGDVGRVEDLYFEDDTWVVRYLVVGTGAWLARRNVLISPMSIHDADWAGRRLPVSLTKAQIEGSPAIDTHQPVSRRHEIQHLGHYGYPTYWGGGSLWGDGLHPSDLLPGAGGYGSSAAALEQAQSERDDAVARSQRNDDPHLRSCNAIVGYHVQARDGDLGHVDGLLFDEQTWAVRYLVVDTGHWWSGHRVLVATQWVESLHAPQRSAVVDLSREAIRGAPPYDPAADLNRALEARLHAHHGRPVYWADEPDRAIAP